jgi:hypothetical protein
MFIAANWIFLTSHAPARVDRHSLGTALVNTPAISATTGCLTTRTLDGGRPGSGQASLALIHGYTTALWRAAGILAAGAIPGGTLLRRGVLAGQGDSGLPSAHARQSGTAPALRA